MELKSQMNRTELIGIVGKNLTQTDAGLNFTVATNYCFVDSDGYPVIDTTWHNAFLPFGHFPENIDKCIEKGKKIYVSGRYAKRNGEMTLIVDKVAEISEDGELLMESEPKSEPKKRKFDVSFIVTTCVDGVAVNPKDLSVEEQDIIVEAALDKILGCPQEYICYDNVEKIEEYLGN